MTCGAAAGVRRKSRAGGFRARKTEVFLTCVS